MAARARSRVTARRARFAIALCGAAVLLLGLVDAGAARPGAAKPAAAHPGARLLGAGHFHGTRSSARSLRYGTSRRGRPLPGLDRFGRPGLPSHHDRGPGFEGAEIFVMSAGGGGPDESDQPPGGG